MSRSNDVPPNQPADDAEQVRIAEGKYLRLVREAPWEYADRVNATGAVAIVAVTPDRELVLTEQYRIPVHCRVIDLPAGLVGDEPDDPGDEAATARKELLEETGFEADQWEHVATCTTSPGMTTEIVSLFLATGVKQTASGGGVGGEKIEIHTVPLDELDAWLNRQSKAGKQIDIKVYAALHFVAR